MKTARERAWECLNGDGFDGTYCQLLIIEKLLEEQDKITREACKQEIANLPFTKSSVLRVDRDEAINACMNAKAV